MPDVPMVSSKSPNIRRKASSHVAHRIGIFTALPLRSLDQLSLQAKLKEIGRMQGATVKASEPT